MIGEKQLAANFRLCVPLPGYQSNYVEGIEQSDISVSSEGNDTVKVSITGMQSEKGQIYITLSYSIQLKEDRIVFKSNLKNNTPYEISEFWFPRIGGWKECFASNEAKLATPGYLDCRHETEIFKSFPGGKGLGAEAAEYSTDYPGMMMPWWDIYDEKSDSGLFMAYLDTIFRVSTWHTYLYPNKKGQTVNNWLTDKEAAGQPVGLIFSHVRYPFIKDGETFETGEFVLFFHEGDWHEGSLFYRDWFMKHFPFDKKDSWLRKKSAWFTSIIYQPEDRIVADYETYNQWCRDAENYGIDCHELIGWNKGGLERDYPEYVPEEKLGGREGFKKLLGSIDDRKSKCLVFVNYNILDGSTPLYREKLKKFTHQDQYGQTPNWMAWGEGTLIARKSISVHRHLLASVTPEFEKMMEDYLLDLVRDGAHGFQIDKMCVGSMLDFNPLNKEKPDVALCEGLIQAIGRLFEKCRKINPNFRIASEAVQDRLLPYVDVYYRNSNGTNISPLRYVFPEWTSCQHISTPLSYNFINGAVLTGSVLCVEPNTYMDTLANPMWKTTAEYIMEVERIRKELADTIFLGKYYDTAGASVKQTNKNDDSSQKKQKMQLGGEVMIPGVSASSTNGSGANLHYAVHGNEDDTQRAIVIVNIGDYCISYDWEFHDRSGEQAVLYEPFKEPSTVKVSDTLEIKGEGLHILVERIKNGIV